MSLTPLHAAHHAESVAAGAHALALTVAGQLSPAGSALATAKLAQLDAQAGQARAAYEASLAGAAISAEQGHDIIRLLNDPRIKFGEKALGLIRLNHLTAEKAAEYIIVLQRLINARAGYVVFAEVAEYVVVGEAYTVERCEAAA